MTEKHWTEEFEGILVFHEKMQELHGIARDGRPDIIAGKTGWGIRETCKSLGLSPRKVVEALKIAKQIRKNPLLKIKSKDYFQSANRKNLDVLLSNVRTLIVIMNGEKSKRFKQLADSLKEDLINYEQGIGR